MWVNSLFNSYFAGQLSQVKGPLLDGSLYTSGAMCPFNILLQSAAAAVSDSRDRCLFRNPSFPTPPHSTGRQYVFLLLLQSSARYLHSTSTRSFSLSFPFFAFSVISPSRAQCWLSILKACFTVWEIQYHQQRRRQYSLRTENLIHGERKEGEEEAWIVCPKGKEKEGRGGHYPHTVQP